MLADVLGDRLQEVGLAETRPAVDEERVVRLRRRLRDGERGRVGEAVRGADTNESKVYFGFIPPGSVRVNRGGSPIGWGPSTGSAPGAAGSGCSCTCRRISRSAPVTSRTAAPIRPRKCPSIHSRVKSFGTLRTNVSPLRFDPPTSPNQVR
jgi:hypothetical protein